MVLRDIFSIYSGDLWAAADPEYDDEPDQVPGGVGPLQMSGEPGELIEPHLGKFGHLLGEITLHKLLFMSKLNKARVSFFSEHLFLAQTLKYDGCYYRRCIYLELVTSTGIETAKSCAEN